MIPIEGEEMEEKQKAYIPSIFTQAAADQAALAQAEDYVKGKNADLLKRYLEVDVPLWKDTCTKLGYKYMDAPLPPMAFSVDGKGSYYQTNTPICPIATWYPPIKAPESTTVSIFGPKVLDAVEHCKLIEEALRYMNGRLDILEKLLQELKK